MLSPENRCDIDEHHGLATGQRWSWEWLFYFRLCDTCLRQWDASHNEEEDFKEYMRQKGAHVAD